MYWVYIICIVNSLFKKLHGDSLYVLINLTKISNFEVLYTRINIRLNTVTYFNQISKKPPMENAKFIFAKTPECTWYTARVVNLTTQISDKRITETTKSHYFGLFGPNIELFFSPLFHRYHRRMFSQYSSYFILCCYVFIFVHIVW